MKRTTVAVLALAFVFTACDQRVARVLDAMVDAATSGDAGAQTGTGTGIDSTNGSRLHMRRVAYTGADGSKYDTGSTEITDTQLNAVCWRSGLPLADGTYRCVPNFTIGYSPGTYADAACTMPIAVATAPCVTTAPAYAVQYDSATCSGQNYILRYFHVGAVHAGTVYSKSGTGPCAADTRYAGWSYYLRGAEAPPSDFVQLTQVP